MFAKSDYATYRIIYINIFKEIKKYIHLCSSDDEPKRTFLQDASSLREKPFEKLYLCTKSVFTSKSKRIYGKTMMI